MMNALNAMCAINIIYFEYINIAKKVMMIFYFNLLYDLTINFLNYFLEILPI